MRWPFGPNLETLQKNKKTKKTKNNKEIKKPKKQKISKNELFSYQSIFLIFLVGVQNFPFLTTWPRKRAPPKHYKNRGFSKPIFEKQMCVTKRPFLDKKNPNSEIPVIIFCLFFSFNNKKHKNAAETPIFIVF